MDLVLARIKNAWKSRTVLLAVAVAIGGYMQAERQTMQPIIDRLPEDLRPMFWPLLGMLMVLLRFITTKPLEKL